jgi:hypothetical protein
MTSVKYLMSIFLLKSDLCMLRSLQPRSQALPSCGGKTLAGAGHLSHRNLIAQGGVGKVSNYMLPLPHFTLRLQGVKVFCTIIVIYRKPPTISPGLIYFRKRFLTGLYKGGLIYGGLIHGRSFVLVINKSDINSIGGFAYISIQFF